MDAQRAEGEVYWSYEGDTGPDRWGGLDPSFSVCDTGVEQSPVDLAGAIPAAAADGLDIWWQPAEARVRDQGHTVQVDMAGGSSIVLEGRRYSLRQFHFHSPAEHTVGGGRSPMEAHFVHAAETGDLAVIGIFMERGESDPNIQRIWESVAEAGAASGTLARFDPRSLLPAARAYFRYSGSLTTPPCSEAVSWVVMAEPISVSQAQLDAFAALHPSNARPVQPLNGRSIRLHR